MLKKLFKHEMMSYLRKWLPIEIIVLGIAILGRIVLFFESENAAYETAFGSMIFFYIMSLIVSFVLTFIVCIKRFHNNLFTGEGYLTFTLPVTPAQHILIKAFAAVTVQIATVFIALFSVGVITAGELYYEILKAVGYILKTTFEITGFYLVLNILASLILFLTTLFTSILLIYACIALGQTFNKNRTGKAVGIFFLYNFLSQIISSVLISILDKFTVDQVFATSEELLIVQLKSEFQMYFGVSLLWNIITGILFFIITHHVINKRLNLE